MHKQIEEESTLEYVSYTEPGNDTTSENSQTGTNKRINLTQDENLANAISAGHINYRSELNDEQYAAVTSPGGYTLVLAGAGSGKTRVITFRVAWLIENGVDYNTIMLLTFTNKAAFSMLSRIEYLLNVPSNQIMGGTFHSVANKFLRKYAEVIGFENNFTILDETDAFSLMRRSRKNIVRIDKKTFPSARVLLNIYSASINHNISVEDAIYRFNFEHIDKIDLIQQIIQDYYESKRLAMSMDYDDLLSKFYKLLSENPDICNIVSKRYDHILVDEFQDTNPLQAQICKLLSKANGNLFVVGDDAQSIYSFRGADFQNILNFPNTYSEVSTYKLQTNYRSYPFILNFANDVMKGATNKFEKELKPVRSEIKKPAIINVYDGNEQGRFVAGLIEDKINEGEKPCEIAVLYRSHRNSQEIEFALTRAGVKYSMRGGLRFIERAHIKDVCAYINIMFNPRDVASWERVLNQCQGVGDTSIERIILDLQSSNEHPYTNFINMNVQRVTHTGQTSLLELKKFLKVLLGHLNGSPQELVKQVTDYIKPYLDANYEKVNQRMEDISQLATYASKFNTVQEFAQDIALQAGFAQLEDQNPEDLEEKVILSTIHQAKGLEWKIVFLISAIEGVIPHMMCFNDPNQLEEERRLMYVAVTRAKDELYISCPQVFSDNFKGILRFCQPSRFIKEVEKGNYEKFNVEFE